MPKSQYNRLAVVFFSIIISLGATGCVSNMPSQYSAAADVLQSGDPAGAKALIDGNGDGLLYNLEEGEVTRLQSPPQMTESTDAFLHADDLVRAWEDNTRTNLERPLGAAGSYFISDSLRHYEGKDYEKSFLSNRLAVNHLVAGDWQAARVEIRKLTDRETVIKEYHEKAAEELSDERAKSGVTPPSVENLSGYPVEIFNDNQVKKLKNSYQSAASHYLAGFIFEALGEPGLAAPGYRQAIELRPDEPFLKDALRHLDHHSESKGESDVLFIVETGSLSPIQSRKISVPIPLPKGPIILTAAYPVIYPSNTLFNPGSLSVAGSKVPLSMTTDIDAMSRRTLKDELPGIILRNTTRMAATAAAQLAAQQMKDKNGNPSPLGGLISLAIGVTSAIVTDADTKHWTVLPAEIFLGRRTLKSGTHTLAISTPSGPKDVKIDISGKYSVVYVRVLGNSVVTLTSKPAK